MTLLTVDAVLLTAACGQSHLPALAPTISEGQPFAHHIRLPSGFRKSSHDKGTQEFDRYAFRLGSSSPNLLLVGACRYEVLSEDRHHLYSPGIFTVDIYDSDPGRRLAALDI
jgi:hypothetical protein